MDGLEGGLSNLGETGANMSLSACLTEWKLSWRRDIGGRSCEKVKGEFDGDHPVYSLSS
jgi:hypothetical protein